MEKLSGMMEKLIDENSSNQINKILTIGGKVMNQEINLKKEAITISLGVGRLTSTKS